MVGVPRVAKEVANSVSPCLEETLQRVKLKASVVEMLHHLHVNIKHGRRAFQQE